MLHARACSALLLIGALLGLLTGCSSSSGAPARSAPSYGLPSLPPRPAFEAAAHRSPSSASSPRESYQFSDDSVTVQRNVLAADRLSAGSFSAQSGSAASGVIAAKARASALPSGEVAKDEDKIEREAQVAIEVKDVNEAAQRILALVKTHEGSITKDQRSSGSQSSAEILVRVPSAHFDAFTSELATIGQIRNRNLKAVDASLEHKDLGILVDNLEAALARYRDLLQKATDPAQVLAVERELERVRSDLDRIKGRLAFLRDRVARSTVAIALHSEQALADAPPSGRTPEISAGLRGVSFVDMRETGTSGYLGSGLSIRLPRSGGSNARGLILDVDIMRTCCKARPERSNWAYDILLGYDLYSEALDHGRRRWLNPYLGARVGFAQTQDRGDFAAAGVFGLEIFKSSALMIDIQARAMALVGNPDGPHAAVQPSIGFDLGF